MINSMKGVGAAQLARSKDVVFSFVVINMYGTQRTGFKGGVSQDVARAKVASEESQGARACSSRLKSWLKRGNLDRRIGGHRHRHRHDVVADEWRGMSAGEKATLARGRWRWH
jgi:hypothetical protein